MVVLTRAIFLFLALIVATHAVDYPSYIGRYNGTSFYYYNLGVTSNAFDESAQTFSAAVSTTGNSFVYLSCPEGLCREIFRNINSSLHRPFDAVLSRPLAASNESYNSYESISVARFASRSDEPYFMPIVSSANDSIGGGMRTANIGWHNGAEVYYFNFGPDYDYQNPGTVYRVWRNDSRQETEETFIFSTLKTHFFYWTDVAIPSDSNLTIANFTRFADIPASWLSNSSISSSDGQLRGIGISASPPTAPIAEPSNTASSIHSSIIKLLLAIAAIIALCNF